MQEPGPDTVRPAARAWMAGASAAWLAVAVAALVRAVDLQQSLWADELYTLRVAQLPWRDVVAHADQTPPLHALLLHLWIKVAGTSEWALRLPSLLAGAGAAGVAVLVGRRFMPTAAALLGGLLVAVHPILVGQAREARAYALLLLLGTLTWWLWLRLREHLATRPATGSRSDAAAWGWTAAYATVGALALYTHLFAAFFLLAQAIVSVAWGPLRSLRVVLIGQALAGAAFLPWLGTLAQRTAYVSSGFWIRPSDWASLGGTLLFLGGSFAILAHVAAWATVAWKRPRIAPQTWIVLGAWTATPVVVPYLISFLVPVYTPRYAMPAAVGYLLLLAACVTALPARLARPVAIVLVVGGLLASVPLAGLDPELTRQDWREASARIDALAAPGEAVLFLPGYCDSRTTDDSSCAWGHYGQRTDLDLIPIGDANAGIRNDTQQRMFARLGNATTFWLVDATPTDDEGAATVRSWLADKYHANATLEPTRLRLTHYERTAT